MPFLTLGFGTKLTLYSYRQHIGKLQKKETSSTPASPATTPAPAGKKTAAKRKAGRPPVTKKNDSDNEDSGQDLQLPLPKKRTPAKPKAKALLTATT